ncbi:MAG: CPBP family intramembrane metalloprotease [Polyangiaceae bacterium]|nr:CPBP family intramembrane metalloprotease [Polyangiaceae bacterium]
MKSKGVSHALTALIVLLAALSAFTQIRRAASAPKGRSTVELTMLAKLAVVGASVPGTIADAYEAPLVEALDKAAASENQTDQARALRRKAIWCAYRRQMCTQSALTSLGQLPPEVRVPAPADEADVLREVLLGPVLQDRRAHLEQRLTEIRVGYFDVLLKAVLLRNLGDESGARAAEERAIQAGWVVLGALFLFGFLLLSGALAWLITLFSPGKIFQTLRTGLRADPSSKVPEPTAGSRYLAVVAVFFAASLALPFVVSGLKSPSSPQSTVLVTLVAELFLLAVVGCAHYAFCTRANLPLGLTGVPLRRSIKVGVFSYLLVWPPLLIVMMPLSALFERLGLPSHTHPLIDNLQSDNHFLTFVLWAVIAAVMAPIVEEVVFRGALQTGIATAYSAKLAPFATAFLFAIVHPQVGLGLVGVFFLGIMLSLVKVHEKALGPSMVMHALNNLVALLMAKALLLN